MRAIIKRKRNDEDPATDELRLPRGSAAQVMRDVDAQLTRVAKTPQDLSRRDLAELYNILQLAIRGHSTQYKATAPMPDAFVEEVYREWQDKSQFVPPVEHPPVFPYRDEDEAGGTEKNLWVFSHEDMNQDEDMDMKAMRKAHPKFESGYYSVEVCFIDESFDFYITGKDHYGNYMSELVSERRLSEVCEDTIAQNIKQSFGRLCDKHNEARAVQYARFYIQQKALSQENGGYVGQYKFEQLSDTYKDRFELGMFCCCVADTVPAFFGVQAERL